MAKHQKTLIILLILALMLGVLLGTPREATGFSGSQPNQCLTVAESFPWSTNSVLVNYTKPCHSFIYASASWPWSYTSAWWPWSQTDTGPSSFFLYYEEELYENIVSVIKDVKLRSKEVYIVLDPGPPRNKTTFLDLHYDEELRVELEEKISGIIGNLSSLGVTGYVLGDEWPRGLNYDEITLQTLAEYNQTYRREMGLWMRADPDIGAKILLAEWFYDRSVQAWNRIARTLRERHPEIQLGTNFDLVWDPDFTKTDVAHWLPHHWWILVDPEPYDFVVTHFLTRMSCQQRDDGSINSPTQIDQDRILRLQSTLDDLLDPQTDLAYDLDVHLLLAAHCVYPYIITPMQMVQEWNTAMGYSDRLAGVGFFAFDLWPVEGGWIETHPIGDTSIEVPLKSNRVYTLKRLLDTCTSSSCLGLGKVILEPGYIESEIWRRQEVLELTIISDEYEGDVNIIGILSQSTSEDFPFLGFEWRPDRGKDGRLDYIQAGSELKTRITIITDYKRHLEKGGGIYELRAVVAPSPCRYTSLWAYATSNPIVLDLEPHVPEGSLSSYLLLVMLPTVIAMKQAGVKTLPCR